MSTDGSEDHKIHCLKENGVAAEAKPDIEQATANLLAQNPVADGGERDLDSFANLELGSKDED